MNHLVVDLHHLDILLVDMNHLVVDLHHLDILLVDHILEDLDSQNTDPAMVDILLVLQRSIFVLGIKYSRSFLFSPSIMTNSALYSANTRPISLSLLFRIAEALLEIQ